MILFFASSTKNIIAVHTAQLLQKEDIDKLEWLFGGASLLNEKIIHKCFVGPRREMISPWSTCAVEMTQTIGINGITRIECFQKFDKLTMTYDSMLRATYSQLDQQIFETDALPQAMQQIDDIRAYNREQSLALSDDEVFYLEQISKEMGRALTDSEVYGFAQVNSEHCRHKIFNGTFVIDGKIMPDTLFGMIRKTSAASPNRLVSAYSDNVAFVKGPPAIQFAPASHEKADFFTLTDIQTVISLKAETHNFPTTVEPFNGAATGTGGEIRDRMAGGRGSIPLVGTAVYMTSYPRLENERSWEQNCETRDWLYHTPDDILIKASNGASDFGNKFGQPLINGSLLTFEHVESQSYGFDKVIMLAGGVGFANEKHSMKLKPEAGDKVVILGGDNYRIGMGGGAVSSVNTGQFGYSVELNAVQRANPEMQKRVFNTIRAMCESEENSIVSIHDHGAGGHINSLSELIDATGGVIQIDALPVGDSTLSEKEILGNESQERMGLLIHANNFQKLKKIAERERTPIYDVGLATSDGWLRFRKNESVFPVNMKLEHFLGKPSKSTLTDHSQKNHFAEMSIEPHLLHSYLNNVLQMEAVACKDWLTNKVDRSVSGKVALQQTIGAVQLPLNNLGVVAIDFTGTKGIATAMGHAPVAGLIDSRKGSRLAVAEALTNVVWAPIQNGLKGVSLSANWMWPANNEGENGRLFKAVKALSDVCIELNINVPTGKDSLSMTQNYPDGSKVLAPGTVIVSAVGEVSDIRKTVKPLLKADLNSELLYINLSDDAFHLGGSVLAQTQNKIGAQAPDMCEPKYFAQAFDTIQMLVEQKLILAGHDVSSGGLITCLLEMNFANCENGMKISLEAWNETSIVNILFCEKPSVVIQVAGDGLAKNILLSNGIDFVVIGTVVTERFLTIAHAGEKHIFNIDTLRDKWFLTSYQFDRKQIPEKFAQLRYDNYKKQDLVYSFNNTFTGKALQFGIQFNRRTMSGVKGAIIREKGSNGDREMAFAMHLAGFDVKDIHMTDLISGREDLSDVNFIAFVGGFSNSDVLGSAKGWAGAFLYNEKAKSALDQFFKRDDTLSLGVCNGCQLMVELALIYPEHPEHIKMLHNSSGKFESAFVNVDIPANNSVMLGSLAGKRLGVWVAHGEGKFSFPCYKDNYNIVMAYGQEDYPGNPNGSDWATAAICSNNGRHLAMMPHLERSFLPWQWPYYPENRENEEVSPWIEAFVNAKNWVLERKK